MQVSPDSYQVQDQFGNVTSSTSYTVQPNQIDVIMEEVLNRVINDSFSYVYKPNVVYDFEPVPVEYNNYPVVEAYLNYLNDRLKIVLDFVNKVINNGSST